MWQKQGLRGLRCEIKCYLRSRVSIVAIAFDSAQSVSQTSDPLFFSLDFAMPFRVGVGVCCWWVLREIKGFCRIAGTLCTEMKAYWI